MTGHPRPTGSTPPPAGKGEGQQGSTASTPLSLRRHLDAVLVDRVREQRDQDRTQVHICSFAVVPPHAITYLSACRFVERTGSIEVGDLHCEVRQTRPCHNLSLQSPDVSNGSDDE